MLVLISKYLQMVVNSFKFSNLFRGYRNKTYACDELIQLTHERPVFPFIKKPVNWYALQINWLVSVW